MKLIQANPNWQVRSLGREDIYAPQRVADAEAQASFAKSNLISDAGEMVSGKIEEYQENERKKALQDATFKRSQNAYVWEQANNKDNYASTEIDKTIDVPQHVRDSGKIPAHMVKGTKWMRESAQDIMGLAEGIENKDDKQAFIREQMTSAQATYGQLQDNALTAQKNARRAEVAAQITTLQDQGADLAALELAKVYPGTVEEKRVLTKKINVTGETRQYKDAVRKGDIPAMKKFAERLASDDYQGYLNFEQRMALSGDLEKAATKMETEKVKAFRDANAQVISDAKYNSAFGMEKESKLAELLEKDLIDRNQYDRLRIQNAKAYAVNIKKTKDHSATADAYQKGEPYTEKEYNGWQESLDHDYNVVEGQDEVIRFATNTKLTTDQTEKYFSDKVQSDNPRVINDMVEFAVKYKEKAPDAYMKLPASERRSIDLYARKSVSGSAITEETIKLNKQAMNITQATRDVRTTAYKQAIKDKPVQEMIDDVIDKKLDKAAWYNLVSTDPIATENFVTAYTNELEFNFMATGNMENAEAITNENMESPQYGFRASNVKGDMRLMKHAPESESYPDGAEDWPKEDFVRFSTGEGYAPETVDFTADFYTEQNARGGEPLSYAMVDSRTLIPLMKDQKVPRSAEYPMGIKLVPLRWIPKERYDLQQQKIYIAKKAEEKRWADDWTDEEGNEIKANPEDYAPVLFGSREENLKRYEKRQKEKGLGRKDAQKVEEVNKIKPSQKDSAPVLFGTPEENIRRYKERQKERGSN